MRVLLVIYDNSSFLNDFPSGMGYIASAIRNSGHNIYIYNQDIHHYSDEHLTKFLDENKFDAVGLGIIAGYYQYKRLLSISDAINKSKNRPIYILGGHMASPEPEYFLRKTKADFIVIGEGEVTIVELLNCIQEEKDFHNIEGIAFLQDNEFIKTNPREQIKDIDIIEPPAYDLFPIEVYRLVRYANCKPTQFCMPMLSSRGCIFRCSFCYRGMKGFRPRSAEKVIEEMKYLKERWRITYVYFFDELLMSSENRSINFSKSLIESNLNMDWGCNGRLNFAKPDVLKIMKEAGCTFINYGIEAMDNEVLRLMNKHLTVDVIDEGIKNTLEMGISPGLNLMFGNYGDSQETLDKAVEFLLKYDDGAQLRTLRPVTPYQGCKLYYDALEKGLIKDIDDFYTNKHLNSDLVSVNFIADKMSTEEIHKALCKANIKLLKNYYNNKLNNMINQTKDLYLNQNTSFRGYR